MSVLTEWAKAIAAVAAMTPLFLAATVILVSPWALFLWLGVRGIPLFLLGVLADALLIGWADRLSERWR